MFSRKNSLHHYMHVSTVKFVTLVIQSTVVHPPLFYTHINYIKTLCRLVDNTVLLSRTHHPPSWLCVTLQRDHFKSILVIQVHQFRTQNFFYLPIFTYIFSIPVFNNTILAPANSNFWHWSSLPTESTCICKGFCRLVLSAEISSSQRKLVTL